LYVKATGDVRHNSNRDMLSSYRYVAPNIRADHTKDWIKAEIGVRSQPVTRFWFDISAGYDIMQDELFMMPVLGHYGSIYGGYDPYGYYGHGYRDFTALYDDGKTEYYANVIDFRHMKAKKFHAGGSFNYQIINNLIFTAKIRGNLWRAENGTTPYGKPKREMGAALAYRPIPKLLLDLNYEHVGGHFLLIGLSEMGTPDINELSLKGTYTERHLYLQRHLLAIRESKQPAEPQIRVVVGLPDARLQLPNWRRGEFLNTKHIIHYGTICSRH